MKKKTHKPSNLGLEEVNCACLFTRILPRVGVVEYQPDWQEFHLFWQEFHEGKRVTPGETRAVAITPHNGNGLDFTLLFTEHGILRFPFHRSATNGVPAEELVR
jgi:hypothetical protein